MLTDKEKRWLEFRKDRKAPCGDETHHCVGCLTRYGCSLAPDWIDAAEFEARAKIIALHLDIEDIPCAHGMMSFCPAKHFKGKGCGDWCRMRMAHLQAEKEMENDSAELA